MLKPFFTYYGGKYRVALRYPKPEHATIVEPFAGAAGYATRHHTHDVILVEKDPRIAALWAYLIRVSASEIRALPDVREHVDEIGSCAEARSLVGFWLNKGAAAPRLRPSAWMREGKRPRSYWGPEIRERIASQVEQIRHWRVICGSYDAAPEGRAGGHTKSRARWARRSRDPAPQHGYGSGVCSRRSEFARQSREARRRTRDPR